MRNLLEEQKMELTELTTKIEEHESKINNLIEFESFSIDSGVFTTLGELDKLHERKKDLIKDIFITIANIKREVNVA